MTTQKQRMLAGELYDAGDPELVAERERARALTHRLNVTEYGDAAARRRILGELLPNAAADIQVEPPFYCDYGYNLFAGEGVYFNFNVVILDGMPVHVGAYTLFGPAVQIYTASHPVDATDRRTGLEFSEPVTIGSDCWIGGGAVVCPGVTIGDRSVIGAGAVVTVDVPADAVAAGNPCRVRRTLGREAEP